MSVPFLLTLSSTCHFLSFDNNHFSKCEAITYCGLICISLMMANQSILKEISPGCSLKGLMLKLRLQYHLMWRADSFERPWWWERLKAGGEGDERGWDGWMASLTQWTWVWVDSGSWWWTGRPGMLWFMGWQRVGHDSVTELNWTDD